MREENIWCHCRKLVEAVDGLFKLTALRAWGDVVGIIPFFDQSPLTLRPIPKRVTTSESLSLLALAFRVSSKMASRKRPREIIEIPDEELEQPDGFQNSGTNSLPDLGLPVGCSASRLRAQTIATGLRPAKGPHSPLVSESSPSAGEDPTKTRYLLRSSGAPYQLLELENDDPQSVDDDTGNERIRKRRRLNNETKSSGLKPSGPQPGTQVKRPPTKSLLAEQPNAVSGSTKHPTRISLSKFPSIIKPKDYPPPLPRIHDKMLERQCFTHRSYTTTMTDYERLEWLGDTFLNYCVARILYSRLPESQEGQLTFFRDHLICNDNIRHYAMMYGFPGKMLLGKQAERCRNPEKAVADTFEAYIGGLLTDQPEMGEKVVFEWISKVTEPQMEEIAKLRPSCNKKAKNVLEALLAAEKAVAPSYVHLRGTKEDGEVEYACLVKGREIVDGSWKMIGKGQWKEVGRGCGTTPKEAQARAAMQVLEELRVAQPSRKVIFMENEAGDFVEIQADVQD